MKKDKQKKKKDKDKNCGYLKETSIVDVISNSFDRSMAETSTDDIQSQRVEMKAMRLWARGY